MKKFSYRMQNVLDIKSKLEEQAKTTYGNHMRILNEERQKLRRLEEKKKAYEEELTSQMLGKLNLVEVQLQRDGIKLTKEEIEAQIVKINNAAHRAEVSRIRLANAMIERKTQEKLKERAFDQYKMEYEAEEQKEIDERNSFKFQNQVDNEEEY